MRVAGGRRVTVHHTCANLKCGMCRPRVGSTRSGCLSDGLWSIAQPEQLGAQLAASSGEEPAASVPLASRKRAHSKSDVGSNGSRKRARSESDVGSNLKGSRKRPRSEPDQLLALTPPALLALPAAAAQAATAEAAPNYWMMQKHQLVQNLSEAEQNLAHLTKEIDRLRFQLAAVEEEGDRHLSQSAHKEGGPGSQRLTKKDPNIYRVFIKCWLPKANKHWLRDMDFHTLTRRPRYICERYAYLTTVGDLKAKIVDATCGMLTAEDHIFFRGQCFANEDILHSLIESDDEVIMHACPADRGHTANRLQAAVRDVSKQLWSMA